MKKILFSTLIVSALLIGCTDTTSDTITTETNSVQAVRSNGTSYVCVGMENSARFGACPGCKLDSDRMYLFLKKTFGYTGYLLQSDYATRSAVIRHLKEAISVVPEGGLFIFYYSGHGGQENLSGWNTDEPEGSDSADEYLCLFDSYLLDDEIWKLISECKGRVFMIFDACHSQTMFRSVQGDIAKDRGLAIPLEDKTVKSSGLKMQGYALPMSTTTFKMLCWSGCLEGEYSYGSSRGGVMTTAILSRWKDKISYNDLWLKVSADVQHEQPTQHPYATEYGSGFTEAFR